MQGIWRGLPKLGVPFRGSPQEGFVVYWGSTLGSLAGQLPCRASSMGIAILDHPKP